MPTNIIVGESGDYHGEHSVIIKDQYGNVKHTNDDWHLVPSPIPIVAPPEFKRGEIENPGGDGIVDTSEAITGFPIFGQRTGSWDFYVLNDWFRYEILYSDILNFVHGKKFQVTLTDDPEWYYNGRLTVNQWSSDESHSKITIDYNFDPYKLAHQATDEEWLWKPFNLKTGVIYSRMFKNISYTNSKTINLKGELIGRRPVTPVFKLASGGTCTKLSLYNPELWGNYPVVHTNLAEGNNHFMDMILSGFNPNNALKIVIQGTGSMSISFKPGKL